MLEPDSYTVNNNEQPYLTNRTEYVINSKQFFMKIILKWHENFSFLSVHIIEQANLKTKRDLNGADLL